MDNQWDQTPGKKEIADLSRWKEQFGYVEEPKASPDGETVAAVYFNDDAESGVCVNDGAWENTFDKIWNLDFTPDGKLFGLVSEAAEWTVAQDDQAWEKHFGFAWNPLFSGGKVAVAVQDGGRYLAAVDGQTWGNDFSDMSDLCQSTDGGGTAAVVQKVSIKEADIYGFQEGCYSVAVNGQAWEPNYLNAWTPVFSPDGAHVAAAVRTSLYDYTISVDGVAWAERFGSIWAPEFSPANGSVTAPVKVPGGWALARDGKLFWEKPFVQLWRHAYGPDGKTIAAVAASSFGKWTVAVDGKPWKLHFGDAVWDLVFAPQGGGIACTGKDQGKWTVARDGKAWGEKLDMVFCPVFSPDGSRLAARGKKDGKDIILVDGKAVAGPCAVLFDPVFSADGKSLLVRGVESMDKPVYFRQVIAL